ncbi:calcineurin-binding protein [Sporothrix schenckii 1099-18]|uniref:Calcineurin-binding protein n=1 Tax=Sporothrix schenckii 1099-18 TaxID=1397361 RepID=A0A0F2MDE3_SPOSC|nr:calcineurin-binding protein [Sporothrix schenckii 1099-18]KJR87104.1 calcineurin-binding protein [Sporothrix schenckii 1099-18]
MDAQAPSLAAGHNLSRSSSSSSLSSSAPSGASSSSLRSRRSSNLTLDLSGIAPPQTSTTAAPAPLPTNTLLFTNLVHADIFRPDNLATIRDLVSQSAAIHSWAPLKSFRRIVASFYSAEDAARVRAVWEGERIMGAACQVYYGRATPLGDATAAGHLALPDAGKLFFISPPPSPPHDWEMRLEGAPNKQVHAEDLADALAKLHHQAADEQPDEGDAKMHEDLGMQSPASESGVSPTHAAKRTGRSRSRSSTLVIYQPAEHSTHSDLPAIAVEDMTDANTDEELNSATWQSSAAPLAVQKPLMAHTARPPVELMQDA